MITLIFLLYIIRAFAVFTNAHDEQANKTMEGLFDVKQVSNKVQ